MHWSNGYGHVGGMGIWWVIGLALVVLIVWALFRSGRRWGDAGGSPEEILKQRYAKGEIDRATYERMLADLQGKGGP